MIKNKKIIFTSGGTGGHIFPAIGIMNYLAAKGYTVVLVTDPRGNQYIRKNMKFKCYTLNTDTLAYKNIFKKIFSVTKIFFSVLNSFFILKKEKPNLIFGLGGYVSFPVSIASKILNIPLVIYEGNIILGKTNKYLLPLAKKLLVANEEISNYSKKYSNKIYNVGNILRNDVFEKFSTKKKKDGEKFSILVLGGSQGAKIFGDIVPETIKKIQDKGYDINIHQQCIAIQKNSLINYYNSNSIENNVFEFSNNIFDLISRADLVISRCGASTSAELVQMQAPFIAVPYPIAVDNHQLFNAKYYEKKGCCWLLEQYKFNSNNLFNLIMQILEDRKVLDHVRENMKKNFNKDVNKNVERELMSFFK